MNKDMNEGVRLLIERMKTNPEEFRIEDGALYSNNRWSKLLHTAVADEKTFTKEEREVVKEAFLEVRRNNFTADVIRTLTVDEDLIKKEWITASMVKNATISTTGINTTFINNGGTK